MQKKELNFEYDDVFEININGARVTLTGEFQSNSKAQVKQDLILGGATILDTIKLSTDILIIGSIGSSAWTNENGGTKLKKALEWKSNGKKDIKIISETDAIEAGILIEKTIDKTNPFGTGKRPIQKKENRCPWCKEKIQEDAIKCPHCRANIVDNPNYEAQGCLIMLGSAVLSFVLFFVLSAIFGHSEIFAKVMMILSVSGFVVGIIIFIMGRFQK